MYNKIFLFSGDQPERLTEMRKVRCERKGWGLGGVASLNFKVTITIKSLCASMESSMQLLT